MSKLVYLLAIFFCSTLWLFFLSLMAPNLAEIDDEERIRFPTSFSDVNKLSVIFKAYHHNHRLYMIILFISAYLYKQAFCIPGSVLLNILGGAIFGFWIALPLCCLLTSIGATCSYLLSKNFAEQIVISYWPKEVKNLRKKIEAKKDGLIPYLLSLRLLPFTPNWLLNLISPVVGIPLNHFFASVFFGLIPYNYICVQSGAVLSTLSSIDDVLTWQSLLKLSFLACMVFVVPKLLKNKLMKVQTQ